MSLADDLAKLEELRRSGSLTDDEFARAKAKVLAGGSAPHADPVVANLSAQLAETRYQNELARIDREWQIEREQYMVADKYGRHHIPTAGMGWVTAIGGGAFGAFATIMAIGITSFAPDAGPFALVKVIFPLFPVAFAIGAIAFGLRLISKAEAYNRAFAAYQDRRAVVKSEDFR